MGFLEAEDSRPSAVRIVIICARVVKLAVIARHCEIDQDSVNLPLNMGVRCARASRNVNRSNLLTASDVGLSVLRVKLRSERGKDGDVVQPSQCTVRIALDFDEIRRRVLASTLRDGSRIVRLSTDEICYRTGLGRVDWRADLNTGSYCILSVMSFACRLVYHPIVRYANSASREWSIWISVLAGSCDVRGGEGLLLGQIAAWGVLLRPPVHVDA